MCGIFAYLNHQSPKERKEIIDILVSGLKRMEYRGYDSAGIAIDGDVKNPSEKVLLIRRAGKVSVLKDAIEQFNDILEPVIFDKHVGIAHTRWATHGSPMDINSHPHRGNEKNEFVVVHNGIITNYLDLKKYLMKHGHVFESETDTEIIAKLTQHVADTHLEFSFREIVEIVVQQLEGAFALAFKSSRFPGELVASRRGSPLLIGIRSKDDIIMEYFPIIYSIAQAAPVNGNCEHLENGIKQKHELTDISTIHHSDKDTGIEYFLASDAAAIIEHTNRALYLEDDDVAYIVNGELTIHRVKRGLKNEDDQKRYVHSLNMELEQIMLGNFKTFMQKEIFEQPESVINTMRGRVLQSGKVVLGGIQEYVTEIRRSRRLIIIACGTSYNSALACRQAVEELTELPVVLELASDFLDRQTPVFRDDACFFVSQSGETADTLMALRYCKNRGALIIGITNSVGSSICRESHCGVHINAGPEIGVASTKAYTSQIITFIMFALVLSEDRSSKVKRRSEIIKELQKLPELIKTVLKLDEEVYKIAQEIRKENSLLIMGRGFNFATCMEGALKIKELSYIHCEGIMSGELKHGPLAMVDENLRIVMVVCNDQVYKKSLNALQQVVARGGAPIIIADEDVPRDDLANMPHVLRVPKTVDCLQNVLSIIPLQLLSYHIADLNGHNVDRPRNLAKSVTVE